jgi:hypothetical protein
MNNHEEDQEEPKKRHGGAAHHCFFSFFFCETSILTSLYLNRVFARFVEREIFYLEKAPSNVASQPMHCHPTLLFEPCS